MLENVRLQAAYGKESIMEDFENKNKSVVKKTEFFFQIGIIIFILLGVVVKENAWKFWVAAAICAVCLIIFVQKEKQQKEETDESEES